LEQQIALFQHYPWPEENIRLSVCPKKNSGLDQREWGLMQAAKRGF
jgi:hypothetical protein